MQSTMARAPMDKAHGRAPAGLLGVSTGTAMDIPTLGQPEALIQTKDGLFDEVRNIGTGSNKFFQGWMD